MAPMKKYLRSSFTLQLILLLNFCSQSTGLICYVTSPNPYSEEQPYDCTHFYVAPSEQQVKNHPANATAPKLFCFKKGFIKGCAWGHPKFEAKCSQMSDEKYHMIVEHLSHANASHEAFIFGHGGPFDFTKQCYCDTDYCNEGTKPMVGSLLMTILISISIIVAAL